MTILFLLVNNLILSSHMFFLFFNAGFKDIAVRFAHLDLLIKHIRIYFFIKINHVVFMLRSRIICRQVFKVNILDALLIKFSGQLPVEGDLVLSLLADDLFGTCVTGLGKELRPRSHTFLRFGYF